MTFIIKTSLFAGMINHACNRLVNSCEGEQKNKLGPYLLYVVFVLQLSTHDFYIFLILCYDQQASEVKRCCRVFVFLQAYSVTQLFPVDQHCNSTCCATYMHYIKLSLKFENPLTITWISLCYDHNRIFAQFVDKKFEGIIQIIKVTVCNAKCKTPMFTRNEKFQG